MKQINNGFYEGERSLFMSRDTQIYNTAFGDGESPLKESENIKLVSSSFGWKYPLWYSRNIVLENCVFSETARAGIWYTTDISLTDCTINAPKNFRRADKIIMENVKMMNAEETLWNCSNIKMKAVYVKGDYFGMNSSDINIEDFEITGNYPFDSCKNIEIKNARMISKDAFWNCENVRVVNSYISGQYLGWNSKNVTFENCVIESEQGMCYMDNVVMKNCQIINTDLCFEYSTVDADVTTKIDSVKNPRSGRISALDIGEIIFDDSNINCKDTDIIITAVSSTTA